MSSIVVFGGSGYAGSHIVEAAAVRGLDVHSVTRSEAAEQFAGARYSTGSLLEAADRAAVLADAETVLVAVSPRGNMAGRVRPAIADLANEAAAAGLRLGVIGGASSLRATEGGPRLLDLPDYAPAFLDEALEMAGVLDDLQGRSDALDWFYVSPAAEFGAHHAGEFRGTYRVGGDTLLTDAEGRSAISGADFGVAIADELETPTHHRARFTVAY